MKSEVFWPSKLQLNPATTDFKGPINFMCYMWNSGIANIRNKREQVKQTKNYYLL